MHKYILPLLGVSVLAGCAQQPSEKTKIVNYLIKATISKTIEWELQPGYYSNSDEYTATDKGHLITLVGRADFPLDAANAYILYVDNKCTTLGFRQGDDLKGTIRQVRRNTLTTMPEFMKGDKPNGR
jgi:hypothetical protein